MDTSEYGDIVGSAFLPQHPSPVAAVDERHDAYCTDTANAPEPRTHPDTLQRELTNAIKRGDVDSVDSLLASGASIERETDKGFSPLVIAILEGKVHLAKFLLQKGANVHHRVKRLPTLVHAAMQPRYGIEVMQQLLDYGAILTGISGPDQKTALHWAAAEGMVGAVDFLINKGISTEAKCSDDRTPAILAAQGGHDRVLKVLWAHGADLQAQSDNGGTPLIWATCRNYMSTVKFLLRKGVDLEQRDNRGHTALSLACVFGHHQIVDVLLEAGADINALSDDPKGCTPIMAAVCSSSSEILESLLVHGADLNIRSSHGHNVLEVALLQRNEKAVDVLLEVIGGDEYPKKSVSIQMAMAKDYATMKAVIATASVMHSYMAYNLGDPHRHSWIDWVLSQGGDLLENMAMSKMLHVALEERDIPMVKALVSHGCDVNSLLDNGHSPLTFAIMHRSLDLIRALLDTGADPNKPLPGRKVLSYTPLDHAVLGLMNGRDTEVVDLLLSTGRCRINRGRDIESTAFSHVLSKASEWEDPDVVNCLAERMIDSIPDVNEDRDDSRCTLLHVAIYYQNLTIINLLLDRGADIHAVAEDGYTPFLLASRYCPDLIPLLSDLGANVKEKYKTNANALHAAAATGNIGALKFLLSHGLDINHQSLKGYTPLTCALTWGQQEAAMYLLEHGASAKWKTERNQTALHFAARHGLENAVGEILKQDIDVNSMDTRGWTPLHEACATGTPTVVTQLVLAGADIDLPNPNGNAPLHIALINESEDIAALLLEMNANVWAVGSRSRTALHLAADYGLLSATQNILQLTNRSLLEVPDGDTWSPLCCCGNPYIVEMLIASGADVHYKDKDGWTALHQAVFNGDTEAALVLVDEGANVDARTTDDGLTVIERAEDMWEWSERSPEHKVDPIALEDAVLRRAAREQETQKLLEEKILGRFKDKSDSLGTVEEEPESLGGEFEMIDAES